MVIKISKKNILIGALAIFLGSAMSFGGLILLHSNAQYCMNIQWLCPGDKPAETAKPIINNISTNSTTKDYCDDYEGMCFAYKPNWKIVENVDPLYKVADGSKSTTLISENDTTIVYTSGILTQLNDTNKNCDNTGYEDMRPFTISRVPASNLNNTDIVQFTWNNQKVNQVRTSLISHEYEPGSMIGGSCGTMVSLHKDEQGETVVNSTQMSSFLSKNHQNQYLIFATSTAEKSQDLQDVKDIFASVRYK